MSAFLAICYDDCIQLLTDGSAIDPSTGRFAAAVEKVWKAHAVPLAITGRGSWKAVEDAARIIVNVANDCRSVDATINAVREQMMPAYEKCPYLFDMLIAGWSEMDGPKLWSFGTHRCSPGFEPFVLHELGRAALGAPEPPPELLAGFETPFSDPVFWDAHGADIFDWMRAQPAEINLFDPDDLTGYSIGGHCQLTTITSEEVTTKTLRTYGDAAGARINPFSKDGTVVPILHSPKQPNQQQRFAMKALEMKRRNQKQRARL